MRFENLIKFVYFSFRIQLIMLNNRFNHLIHCCELSSKCLTFVVIIVVLAILRRFSIPCHNLLGTKPAIPYQIVNILEWNFTHNLVVQIQEIHNFKINLCIQFPLSLGRLKKSWERILVYLPKNVYQIFFKIDFMEKKKMLRR